MNGLLLAQACGSGAAPIPPLPPVIHCLPREEVRAVRLEVDARNEAKWSAALVEGGLAPFMPLWARAEASDDEDPGASGWETRVGPRGSELLGPAATVTCDGGGGWRLARDEAGAVVAVHEVHAPTITRSVVACGCGVRWGGCGVAPTRTRPHFGVPDGTTFGGVREISLAWEVVVERFVAPDGEPCEDLPPPP